MVTECTWPMGCFQPAAHMDADGCCGYHRKVLEGLITPPTPEVPEWADVVKAEEEAKAESE